MKYTIVTFILLLIFSQSVVTSTAQGPEAISQPQWAKSPQEINQLFRLDYTLKRTTNLRWEVNVTDNNVRIRPDHTYYTTDSGATWVQSYEDYCIDSYLDMCHTYLLVHAVVTFLYENENKVENLIRNHQATEHCVSPCTPIALANYQDISNRLPGQSAGYYEDNFDNTVHTEYRFFSNLEIYSYIPDTYQLLKLSIGFQTLSDDHLESATDVINAGVELFSYMYENMQIDYTTDTRLPSSSTNGVSVSVIFPPAVFLLPILVSIYSRKSKVISR